MQNKNRKIKTFIEKLLDHPLVKQLEEVEDQGVKVSTHTYDVLDVTKEMVLTDFGTLKRAARKVDIFSMVIGIIIHDLSKGSIRKGDHEISHSQVMLKNPEYIIEETEKILSEIEEGTDLKVKENYLENIIHIVVSHHGRWGKIRPGTWEASVVHKADVYSAKHHRINPIKVSDILGLMNKGNKIEEIAILLNTTPGVVKDRLKRSKQELMMKTNKQLLEYYKKGNEIPIGDNLFTRRILETEKLIKDVEGVGFKKLILENEILDPLEDWRIFEKKRGPKK